MAALHGKKGALYVGLASSSAEASKLPKLTSWTIDETTDFVEVTSMDDSNKTYVAGFPDASGTFACVYDTAGNSIYTAVTTNAGDARKFYLYPDRTDSSKYWFGTGLFDVSTSSSTTDAARLTGNWRAATAVSAVGIT